ncbi:MAG: alkaline phosphatase family protein [Halobaculum sp.]
MLVVLGIDALDHEHVDRFGTENLRLSNSTPIETFSYMKDQPYTLEVWPTVATGLHPSRHGVTGGNTSEWDNPIVDALSGVTAALGGNTRDKLGSVAESLTGATYSIPETEADHIFDRPGRVVHNWPGVHNSRELERVWELSDPAESGGSVAEFERAVYGIGAEQFGWVEEMTRHDLSLVGCHVHTLDLCGHVFRNDKERYRRSYEWMDDHVGRVRDALGPDDDLLILSDHGIHTSWDSSDVEPSRHSLRAMAATTHHRSLFTDVYDAREWIEAVVDPVSDPEEGESLDAPTDRLEDLGYI